MRGQFFTSSAGNVAHAIVEPRAFTVPIAAAVFAAAQRVRPGHANPPIDPGGTIPEGRPIKAKLGINQLVLVRQGERILALHDVCAHAGGPLSEGKLVDGQIECPWHYSRYRMANGDVTRGPSVYHQPAYEVRAKDGGGWEARRQPA